MRRLGWRDGSADKKGLISLAREGFRPALRLPRPGVRGDAVDVDMNPAAAVPADLEKQSAEMVH